MLQDVMCMQSQVTAEAGEEEQQIVKAQTDYFLSLIHADAREAAAASAHERERSLEAAGLMDGRSASRQQSLPL